MNLEELRILILMITAGAMSWAVRLGIVDVIKFQNGERKRNQICERRTMKDNANFMEMSGDDNSSLRAALERNNGEYRNGPATRSYYYRAAGRSRLQVQRGRRAGQTKQATGKERNVL